MASGWAKDGAVQDQIDASIDEAIARSKVNMPRGESATHCEECDAFIPEARRIAIPGVQLCIRCQTKMEKQSSTHSPINRRGSKDSQLR